MFPNLRLLIAAAMASVVVLLFGFGMLAALRISREPLAHVVPVVSMPLPPLADSDGARPLAFAPAEPFDRRFQTGEPQQAGDAMAALTLALTRAHREKTQAPPPAAATASPATETIAATEPAAAATANEVVTAPAAEVASSPPPPAEPAASPPLTRPAPEASDDPPVGSLPEHQATAAGNVEAPRLATAPVTADPAASEPAAILAAIEPPAEPLKPASDSAPASAAAPAPAAHKAEKKTEKKAEKAEKKAEKAGEAKPRHAHAARRHAPPANTDGSFQQPNFVTAPPWPAQPARTRRAKVASGQARGTNAGTGGPFVNAYGQ